MKLDEDLTETLIEQPVDLPVEGADSPSGDSSGGQDLDAAQGQLTSGASWFYWLAGLSIINSVIVLANGEWSFLFGLGITQVVDAIVLGVIEEAADIGMVVKIVGFLINFAIAGIFVLFGWFANRRHLWAFFVGMFLYALDALIFLLVGDYLGLAFHGWVLFSLSIGLKACLTLRRADANSSPALHPT